MKIKRRLWISAIMLIFLLMSICPAHVHAQTISASDLPDGLDTFLQYYDFSMWHTDYDSADATACDQNMIERILWSGSICDVSIYPVVQPAEHYKDGTMDPLGWYETTGEWFDVYEEETVRWIAKNIFNMTDSDIDAFSESSQSDGFYLYDGYYYAFCGGVGGPGFDFDYISIERDGDRYTIIYNCQSAMHPCGEEDLFLQAVLEYRTIDGGQYWTLISQKDVTEAVQNGTLETGAAETESAGTSGAETMPKVTLTPETKAAETKAAAEKIPVSYNGASVELSGDLFEQKPSVYNNELAKLGAMLATAAGRGLRETSDLFHSMGVQDDDLVLENFDAERFAYAIGHRSLEIDGEDTNVLFIVARGSVTWNEFKGDYFTKAESSFYGYTAYDIAYEFEQEVFSAAEDYYNDHPELEAHPLRIFVTGHSLGGACANLVAARFDMFSDTGYWKRDEGSDIIYAYTYGAIDSIKTRGRTVSKGFENIHNIYNFYDTFGPNGRVVATTSANSEFGKFGHMDEFKQDFTGGNLEWVTECENHQIANYLTAINDHKVYCQRKTSRMYFHCPVNVEVYRGDELVTGIYEDGSWSDPEDENVGIYECDGGKAVIIFDSEDDYKVVVTATDSGTMDVEIMTTEDGTPVNDETWEDVELVSGRTFTVSSAVIKGNEEPAFETADPGEEEDSGKWVYVLLLVAAAVLLAVFIVIIILMLRSQKKDGRGQKENFNQHENCHEQISGEQNRTVRSDERNAAENIGCFCPKCGTKMPPKAQFCARCGYRLK